MRTKCKAPVEYKYDLSQNKKPLLEAQWESVILALIKVATSEMCPLVKEGRTGQTTFMRLSTASCGNL